MAASDEVLKRFHKRWDKDVGAKNMDVPVPDRLPSGVIEFDIATGGGWPAGNLSIVYGAKDTGKSNLLYVTIATYLDQHPDKVVAFLDLERNYDSPYGKLIGIDESRLMFLVPDYGEMAGDMIQAIILEADDVGLIAVDSLAQMIPMRESEDDMEKFHPGSAGRLASKLCRKTANNLMKIEKRGRRPTVLYCNQTRSKIGVVMGNPTTMPGGQAPGFYSSTIVRMYGGKEALDADVDPSKPSKKEIRGVIEKKKGQIVSRNFEYDMALMPQKGVRVGRSLNDWKVVSTYLADMGQFGKVAKGGYTILGQEFRLQKECRTWYEENRLQVSAQLIEHLMEHPGSV